MSNTRVSIGSSGAFSDAIKAALQDFGKDVSEELVETMDQVGKEAVKKLKSYKTERKGRYSKGWKYQREKKRLLYEAKIFNSTSGQLTHLIEHGHPIIRNGQVVGHAKPHPHIEPVNEWMEGELVRVFQQKMNQGG